MQIIVAEFFHSMDSLVSYSVDDPFRSMDSLVSYYLFWLFIWYKRLCFS
jgi:hypothetical protein